jgi:6-phosphogluconolactonase
MVHKNLLSKIPIPDENVHPVQCEEDAQGEAERYEGILQAHFLPEASPRFDLVVLALGSQGQMGSLYPQSRALEARERWVVADFVQNLGEWRITLTPSAINHAKSVLLLAVGKETSDIVGQSLESEGPEAGWPATHICPEDGELNWFIDEPAATAIKAEADN